jgi:hypothetical protein
VSGRKYSREQSVRSPSVIHVTPDSSSSLAFIYPAPWGKLFKRGVIGNSRFPENPIPAYEDTIFFLSLCPKIRRYVVLPDVLYHYVVHDESSITRTSHEKTMLFRNDLMELRRDFEKDGLQKHYLSFLDLAAFIHIGIADIHRTAINSRTPLRVVCADAKNFLDSNFPSWRNITIRPYSKFSVRSSAVWLLKWLHLSGTFTIFIHIYNWMIRCLHVDIKW